jgi:hypothetical protein
VAARSQRVYNFTEKARNGLNDQARILLAVKNGNCVPVQ